MTAVDIAPLTLKLVEKAANELGYEVNSSDGARIHTQVIGITDNSVSFSYLSLVIFSLLISAPISYLYLIICTLRLISTPSMSSPAAGVRHHGHLDAPTRRRRVHLR